MTRLNEWIAAWQMAEPLDASVITMFMVTLVLLIAVSVCDVLWRRV